MTAEVQGGRGWEGQLPARDQGGGQAGEITAQGQEERSQTGEMTVQGQGESRQLGEMTAQGQGERGQKRGRTEKRLEERGQKKGRTEEGQEERSQKRGKTEEEQGKRGQKRERTEERQEERIQKRERTEGRGEKGQKRERNEEGREENDLKREISEEREEEKGQRRDRKEKGQAESGQKRKSTKEGQGEKSQKRETNEEGQGENGQTREWTEERQGERGQEGDRGRAESQNGERTEEGQGKGSQEKQLTVYVHEERGQKGERNEDVQGEWGQEAKKAREGGKNADGQENKDQIHFEERKTPNGLKMLEETTARVYCGTEITSGRQNQCSPNKRLTIHRPIPKDPNEIVVFELKELRKGTEFSLKVVKETLKSVKRENLLAQTKHSKMYTKYFEGEDDGKFIDADFDVCGKSFKFVRGYFNVPKSTFQVYILHGFHQLSGREDSPQMYTRRLMTFRDFPGNAKQSAIKLAERGFIYLGAGDDDMLVCCFCELPLNLKKLHWSDDIPHIHRNLSPDCPMVRSGLHESGPTTPPQLDFALEDSAEPKPSASAPIVRANATIIESSAVLRAVNERSNGTTLEEKGISTEKPKHPLQSQLRQRLETMRHIKLPKNKRNLVEAGFFYAEDSTFCCFFCGVCVHNWDPDDNVWIRHAQNSPQCFWLKMKTGELFIELVQTSQDQVNSCVAV